MWKDGNYVSYEEQKGEYNKFNKGVIYKGKEPLVLSLSEKEENY